MRSQVMLGHLLEFDSAATQLPLDFSLEQSGANGDGFAVVQAETGGESHADIHVGVRHHNDDLHLRINTAVHTSAVFHRVYAVGLSIVGNAHSEGEALYVYDTQVSVRNWISCAFFMFISSLMAQ